MTIISPSWLEVENAITFLMSFWVKAQQAVNAAVSAPRHRQRVRPMGLFSSRGLIRIRRKTPATTIVLEWRRADTGVGPSMAEGSQGCRPNWADLPAAAIINPKTGGVTLTYFAVMKICSMSHEFWVVAIQAMAKISPMSPIRL